MPPAIVSARLNPFVSLQTDGSGMISVLFGDQTVVLGTFSIETVRRAKQLAAGLPLNSIDADDRELGPLIRRLAKHGLLEYGLREHGARKDRVVIEPQFADYWPALPEISDKDSLVLSRFAYMRRRAGDLVLESPRSGALFRVCDPAIAAMIAKLNVPQPFGRIRRWRPSPGTSLLALLLDCQILIRVDDRDTDLRQVEGDDDLMLWEFHDLVFHARSTEGRHANPLGGVYPFADRLPPPPALRPPWPGARVKLPEHPPGKSQEVSDFGRVLNARHSTRSFDDNRPISISDLSVFLARSARILSTWTSSPDGDDDSPPTEYTVRPYPSAGASYELELYLAVNACGGIARGFYHYDAGEHALVRIACNSADLDLALDGAAYAMGVLGPPQVLITVVARFGRVSWKYSSIAYALVLKDAGVLTQTFYLVATDMALGGCAIGSVNIDLFAKMTGLRIHAEGPVAQFALGRGANQG